MNVGIRKEIRSILPVFILTIAVTTLASLILNGSDASGIVVFIYTACAGLLAAGSFGNEYLWRTMPLLLTHPTPRARLWADKMKVLGCALAITWFVMVMDIALFIRGEGRPGNLQETAFCALGLAIIAFCSTPFSTLILKNIIGAMGATFALPWGLFMVIMGGDYLISWLFSSPVPFFAQSFSDDPYLYIVPFGALYCATMCWLGFKTFTGMQLIDAQSQEIRLPSVIESTLGPVFLGLLPRYTSPASSLIRKELQLQRPSFVFTGAMCVLMGMAMVIFAIYPSEITSGLMLAPFVITAMIVPLIVGGLTFSEERNLGIACWHLTMPPSIFKQWSVKVFVSTFVCAILGIILPLAMVQVMKPLFAGQHGLALNFFPDENAVITWIFSYLFAFSLILYAASISTNTFRAIIAALGIAAGMLGLCPLTAYFLDRTSIDPLIPNSLLIHFIHHNTFYTLCIGIALVTISCVAVLIFARLAFVNFRRGELTARHRWVQLAAIGSLTIVFAAIVMILDSAALRHFN